METMMQFGIGLGAGGGLGYLWMLAETESKWFWTSAIVAVALGLSLTMTPLQYQAVNGLCVGGEACDAAKSFTMIALFASGATLVGGLIGWVVGLVAFDPERHRVKS